jgi:hypothetical protein
LCIFNYNTLPRIGGCILSMTITIYCPWATPLGRYIKLTGMVIYTS